MKPCLGPSGECGPPHPTPFGTCPCGLSNGKGEQKKPKKAESLNDAIIQLFCLNFHQNNDKAGGYRPKVL